MAYGDLSHRENPIPTAVLRAGPAGGAVGARAEGRPQLRAHRSMVFILLLSRRASSWACLLSSCCCSKYFICF